MIKVLAITGIRSEYTILYPVVDALRNDPRFDIRLVVSGAHLSDWHGYTIQQIENDGFLIADRIDDFFTTNRKTQRVKSTGILTYALAQTVEREMPDFLLVVGDREESIATALVGNYMDILTVHIGGGDPVYGNSDDPIRFAVSKLSHIHCTTTKKYADNLRVIGEEDFRIFSTGNPALDIIRRAPLFSSHILSSFLDFDILSQKYIVLIQHPLSSEQIDTAHQIEVTLEVLEKFCADTTMNVVAIYPNTDPGSIEIIAALERYREKSFLKVFKTLDRDIFINLMRHACVLVGNSSMGILEAPFYQLPVVNVGARQRGRLNAGNVEFVEVEHEAIHQALTRACFDRDYRKKLGNAVHFYGDGKTSDKIVNILASIDLKNRAWYVKKKLC